MGVRKGSYFCLGYPENLWETMVFMPSFKFYITYLNAPNLRHFDVTKTVSLDSLNRYIRIGTSEPF